MTENTTYRKGGFKIWILHGIREIMNALGRVAPGLVGRFVFYLLTRPKRRLPNLDKRITGLQTSCVRGPQGGIKTYSWAGSPRALLVHGWDSNVAEFGRLIPLLQKAGWGGIAYDAPAHGYSDGATTDFLKLGSAFRRIYAEHGPFDAIVAHSFGSAVSIYQLNLIQQPYPNSLVIGGSPHSLSQVFNIFASKLKLSDIVRQDLDRRIIDRLGRPVSEFDFIRSLEALPVPSLIIHDLQDPLVPFNSAERLHHAAKESRLLVTNGLKHRRWLRNNEILKDVIGFLEQNRDEDRAKENMNLAA